jgi:hypothetical protein
MSVISGGNVIEGAFEPRQVAGAPSAGTSEVQTITVTPGGSLGGTYRLRFEGFETTALADDALGSAVQTALRALKSIGTSGCSVAGDGPYVVTFTGDLGKKALGMLESTAEAATDSSEDPPLVEIAETTPGVTATHRGAPIGAILIDTDNGIEYINTGTPNAPTWTKVGTQS